MVLLYNQFIRFLPCSKVYPYIPKCETPPKNNTNVLIVTGIYNITRGISQLNKCNSNNVCIDIILYQEMPYNKSLCRIAIIQLNDGPNSLSNDPIVGPVLQRCEKLFQC